MTSVNKRGRGSYAKAKYIACAERGLTQAETAREMGVTHQAVSYAARAHGIAFAQGRRVPAYRPPSPGRIERLRALAAEGVTQSEAARREGISRQAVHILAKKHGLVFGKARRQLSEASQ